MKLRLILRRSQDDAYIDETQTLTLCRVPRVSLGLFRLSKQRREREDANFDPKLYNIGVLID